MDNRLMNIELGTLTPDFELNPIIDTSKYGNIRQDSIINGLSLISSKTPYSIDEVTGAGQIDIINGLTSIEVLIQKFSNTTLKQSTSKLLTLFDMEFTQAGANRRDIHIALKDVAEILGLKNLNKARVSIKKDLEALYNISIEAQKPSNNGKPDYIKFRVCEAQGINNGVIHFMFTEAIANHLKKGNIMPVPYKLLQIESNSQKNPYAYPLGLKITQQMKMNQYDKQTKEKKDTCTISVEKLLEVCINYGMPTYEQISKGSRRLEEQIIKPFERDLDACDEIFKWEYCKSGGEPLTEEELENRTYKEYITRYIKITYPKDYPIEDYNAKKAKKNEAGNKKKKKTA